MPLLRRAAASGRVRRGISEFYLHGVHGMVRAEQRDRRTCSGKDAPMRCESRILAGARAVPHKGGAKQRFEALFGQVSR